MGEPVILAWSGGKDSAMSLYELWRSDGWHVVGLLTTVTEDYDRVSMHGVRTSLLRQQAASLRLPLDQVLITKQATNEEYEARMKAMLGKYSHAGISTVAFGDIYLEDIREYRQNNLAKIGMSGVFPLWKRNTSEIARTFVDLGFEAVLTCVDSNSLDGRFVGRAFDREFQRDLPAGVDPCGERGEFHSFVHAGPIFSTRVGFARGEVVLRNERYYYCDLIPSETVA